jgi:GNAT superfamily N-acetyltransferase
MPLHTLEIAMWPDVRDHAGTLTDLFARGPATNAELLPNCLVFKTPSRPDYWFGNYIVCRKPITLDSLHSITADWQRHFLPEVGLQKKIIQWETPVKQFGESIEPVASASNSEVDINLVRAASRDTFKCPDLGLDSADIEVSKVVSNDQYEDSLSIALAEHHAQPDWGGTDDFVRWRFDQRRRSVINGAGDWWLLKFRGVPVATCGLFFDTNRRTGRFREVTTHPKWRRRGFATILCASVMQHGFDIAEVDHIVIVSMPGSSADGIYERLGLQARSYQIALVADL